MHTFLFGPEARDALPASALGEWWFRPVIRQPYSNSGVLHAWNDSKERVEVSQGVGQFGRMGGWTSEGRVATVGTRTSGERQVVEL